MRFWIRIEWHQPDCGLLWLMRTHRLWVPSPTRIFHQPFRPSAKGRLPENTYCSLSITICARTLSWLLYTYRPMVKGIPRKLRLLWDRMVASFTVPRQPRSTNLNSHLHVLRPGAPLRNKVEPTTVMKLLWDFAYNYVPNGCYRWKVRLLFWYIKPIHPEEIRPTMEYGLQFDEALLVSVIMENRPSGWQEIGIIECWTKYVVTFSCQWQCCRLPQPYRLLLWRKISSHPSISFHTFRFHTKQSLTLLPARKER